jgi:YkoY family integral membrane protein
MDLQQLLQSIIDHPLAAILIVGNLIIIESLLSVDNAAVLATMVLDLPKYKRKKALKYGIIGAYIFRGAALLLASFLVKFWFLKPLGGLYLIYIFGDWCQEKMKDDDEEVAIDKHDKWIYKKITGAIGNFWATVILVELMDIAFSVDNVFAAVAFSNNILLIWLGVSIGILAMRFVAQIFVDLMERFPFLETCAFIVIGILGIKLLLSIPEHFYPASSISLFLDSREADWITSAFTISVFILPFLVRILFYHPKKDKDLNI